MTPTFRFACLAALLALAACGKMGPPEKPPNATWPKGYPAGAVALPIPSLPNSGADETGQSKQARSVAADRNAAFTNNGAWIDPDMSRPTINPAADQDKYHLNDSIGY